MSAVRNSSAKSDPARHRHDVGQQQCWQGGGGSKLLRPRQTWSSQCLTWVKNSEFYFQMQITQGHFTIKKQNLHVLFSLTFACFCSSGNPQDSAAQCFELSFWEVGRSQERLEVYFLEVSKLWYNPWLQDYVLKPEKVREMWGELADMLLSWLCIAVCCLSLGWQLLSQSFCVCYPWRHRFPGRQVCSVLRNDT